MFIWLYIIPADALATAVGRASADMIMTKTSFVYQPQHGRVNMLDHFLDYTQLEIFISVEMQKIQEKCCYPTIKTQYYEKIISITDAFL